LRWRSYAQTSGQKGVLWWAAHHRDHHLHSDRGTDLTRRCTGLLVVTPRLDLSDEYDTSTEAHLRLQPVPSSSSSTTIIYCRRCSTPWRSDTSAAGTRSGATSRPRCAPITAFLINSLTHIWDRRFATPDESRNNFVLAIVTLGEGWHNNHHHYMSSVRQGIKWWEIDITYYVLVVLSWIGVTRDLRPFTPATE
jgi:stearoyl-CoA desaturase (delta-9 desaturase)